MKTPTATVSSPGNLREQLEVIVWAEFDGIEIFERHFITDAATPIQNSRMNRDHGLEILQRTGAQYGYVAPNAPFGIAAQIRLMRPNGVPRH